MVDPHAEYLKIFEVLLRDSKDAVALCDTEQVIIAVNPVFTELFGHSLEEATGKRLDLLVATTPEMMENSDAQVDRIKMWESVHTETVLRTHKDGSIVPVTIEGNVFRLASGDSLVLWNYRGMSVGEEETRTSLVD